MTTLWVVLIAGVLPLIWLGIHWFQRNVVNNILTDARRREAEEKSRRYKEELARLQQEVRDAKIAYDSAKRKSIDPDKG